jgi:hypothetical protein
MIIGALAMFPIGFLPMLQKSQEGKAMRGLAIAVSSYLGFAAVSVAMTFPAQAQEERCGIVHKQTREPVEGQRFWPLATYGGRAFLDMRTCLVARLEVFAQPMTLSEASLYCATLGQGGPLGQLGWQLPTLAELTSLDAEEWTTHRDQFEQFKLPPLNRSGQQFWTNTKIPGTPDLWAVVEFSPRTTVVGRLAETMKAGAWCVHGIHATGLK